MSLTSILWKIEQYKPENSEVRNVKELERTFSRGNGNSFQYTSNGFDLHERIVRLVNAIHKGASKDVFGFEISGFKETIFSDVELKVFTECKIPNKNWVSILFMLGYTKSETNHSRKYQQIPYEFFTPRQLGSIYESFLEFKLDKAETDLVFFKKKWQPGNLDSEKVKQMDVPKVRKGQLYFTPNNEERKATGSYYTPDEVVQLIVRETLDPLVKNKTSSDILKMKVADTAMGSGHFLSGTLNYLAKKYLETLKNEVLDDVKINITDAKQAVLHNCIFGADINSRAVKLAKMSLWLESASTNKKLENLDDQVKCTNSLTDYNLWKKEWKFLDSGIDAVVGNPPYLGEKGHKEIFQTISQQWLGARFHQGKMDLFYFFFHLGLDILKAEGRLGFITTNYYITASGARKLRQDLYDRSNIDLLLNLNELKVFGEAAGQHNMITILTKTSKKNDTRVINSNENGICSVKFLAEIYNGESKKTSYSKIDKYNLFDGEDKYIRLGSSVINGKTSNSLKYNKIIEKIKGSTFTLKDVGKISAGPDISTIKITKSIANKYKGDFCYGDGVFVLNEKEVSQLQLNIEDKRHLKTFIKNSNIHKFGVDIAKEKLIYFTWSETLPVKSGFKKHFDRFKSVLTDQMIRFGENYPLYALHRPRDPNIFEAKKKIIVPYRAKENIFGWAEAPIYSARDVLYITEKNVDFPLEALLGILNSKLIFFWLTLRGKTKGNTLELVAVPLSEIPIPTLGKHRQALCDISKNLIMKQSQFSLDKLNALVYSLYEIGNDDQKLVEEFYQSNLSMKIQRDSEAG